MVEVTCKYCNWVWNYKGNFTGFVTCPNCTRKTPLKKKEEKKEDIEKEVKEIPRPEKKKIGWRF